MYIDFSGRQDDSTHIDFKLFCLLFEIDRFGLAYAPADIALVFLKKKTAFINIGDQGYGLRKVDVNGFVFRYFLIELIRVFHRAIFYACTATGTFVLDNVSGFPCQGYLKITFFPFYRVNFSKRENLYVWMPADLDQFG